MDNNYNTLGMCSLIPLILKSCRYHSHQIYNLNPPCSQFEFDLQSQSGISKHMKSFQDSIPIGIPSNNWSSWPFHWLCYHSQVFEMLMKCGISGASSSTLFYNSNEDASADGGALSSIWISSRPECQMNKTNLLFMRSGMVMDLISFEK